MKPRFKQHICKSESNCEICRDYINKLDDHRQSITGGAVKNYKSLSRTSANNSGRQMIKTRQGKRKGERKFDLPKPRLVGPLTLS